MERLSEGGCGGMKQGKVPTKRQKMAIMDAGLSPENYLIVRVHTVTNYIEIMHRETGKTMKIPA